jgi:hypothetical protein
MKILIEIDDRVFIAIIVAITLVVLADKLFDYAISQLETIQRGLLP